MKKMSKIFANRCAKKKMSLENDKISDIIRQRESEAIEIVKKCAEILFGQHHFTTVDACNVTESNIAFQNEFLEKITKVQSEASSLLRKCFLQISLKDKKLS